MKKYGIFSNYAYFLSRWWKADRKLFALTGADIGLNVLAAAGITLLSAWVVSLLERHLALENVLLTIGMAVVGYVLIQSALEFYNVMASFRVRKAIVQHFSMGLVQKSLELSYERLEENGIQEERKMAQLAVLDGLEEFWYSTSEILVNALKLLVFGGVVASLNPVLILILTGICLIQLTGYKIAADYEQKTKEKLKGLNVTKEYIQNKAFDVSVAKDIRLYQMQDWLKAVFRRTNRQYTRIRSRIGVGYFLYNIVEQLLQLIREAVIYGYLIYQISQGLNASLAVLYLRSATEFTDRFLQALHLSAGDHPDPELAGGLQEVYGRGEPQAGERGRTGSGKEGIRKAGRRGRSAGNRIPGCFLFLSGKRRDGALPSQFCHTRGGEAGPGGAERSRKNHHCEADLRLLFRI